jgi:hypothetical protein
VIEKVWLPIEEEKELLLTPLANNKSFCDGIGIPKTKLTQTTE